MARPEKVFKVGGCTASVFENNVNGVNGGATLKSVTLQRAYKDKDGNFQHTNSFNLNDIPKAVLALEKAYHYLLCEKDPASAPGADF
jgi:hypothetical protein